MINWEEHKEAVARNLDYDERILRELKARGLIKVVSQKQVDPDLLVTEVEVCGEVIILEDYFKA